MVASRSNTAPPSKRRCHDPTPRCCERFAVRRRQWRHRCGQKFARRRPWPVPRWFRRSPCPPRPLHRRPLARWGRRWSNPCCRCPAALGAGATSTTRGAMASLCRSGKVILRLLHSASGNLRRNGPIACGQSAVSPAPGMIITAPLGSAVLAGFHKARNVSAAGLQCCCS